MKEQILQHRMLAGGDLLNGQGGLMEPGYHTQPLKRYDRGQVTAPRHRIKEWDYYLIMRPDVAIALTIADNGYMGLDSLSFINLATLEQKTLSVMQAFPLGQKGLPADSEQGSVRAGNKQYAINFTHQDGARHVYGHCYDFWGKDKPLLFDFVLGPAPADRLVIATPFKKTNQFYYNQKIVGLPAQGRVIADRSEYIFSPPSSFGILDWGRGVWPRRDTWYWAAAWGWADGQPLSFNLGHGFGDTSKATENMLFYRGIGHKLGEVRWDIPKHGRQYDYLKPWRMVESSGRLDLSFTPILDRAAKQSALVISSDQHQVFGHYRGFVILDDGRRVMVDGLVGFAERVKNVW